MPRDSNGTYSLPAGNPVVTLTTIASTWANSTLGDIATALTGSLARDGSGGMTGPLKLPNGLIGAPALSWSTEPTSGLYRNAAGDFRYSISSNDVFQLSSALINATTAELKISSTNPLFSLFESDGAADEKTYQLTTTAGDMFLRTRTDAGGAGVDILQIVRAGTGITSKTWPTGINVFGDLLRSDTDATDDLGTTAIRWRRGYFGDLRKSDSFFFLDESSSVLRLGGTGGSWIRVESEYPGRFTFPSAGGVSTLQLTSTLPVFEANDTDAAADAKIWDDVYQTGVRSSRLVNDARNSTLTYRTVTRTGVASAIVNYGTGVQLQALGREVGYRNGNRNTQNAGYTFVADDAGRVVAAGSAGTFTVNNNVFQAGDMITFENTAGTCTIAGGAGVTLRLVGTPSTTGNRTSTSFSVGYIFAQTPAVFLVGGGGIT